MKVSSQMWNGTDEGKITRMISPWYRGFKHIQYGVHFEFKCAIKCLGETQKHFCQSLIHYSISLYLFLQWHVKQVCFMKTLKKLLSVSFYSNKH